MIFTTLLLGISIFSGFVVLFIITRGRGVLNNHNEIFKILKWIYLVLIIFPGSFAIIQHRKKTNGINSSISLDKKLHIFRNSFIIKILIFDFICIYNTFLLLFYGNVYLTIPLILFLLYLLLNRPSVNRISEEIKLSVSEKDELKELP